MHTIVTTFFLLNLFFPTRLPEAAQSAAQTTNSPQTDPAIVARSNDYLKAVLSADVPALTAIYSHDAVLMPSEHPLLRGTPAIEQYYREWFKAKITDFRFAHLESRVLGETAYDVGTYTLIMSPAPNVTVTDSGKYNVILKRSGEDWKVAYLIFNSDSPSRTPAKQTSELKTPRE